MAPKTIKTKPAPDLTIMPEPYEDSAQSLHDSREELLAQPWDPAPLDEGAAVAPTRLDLLPGGGVAITEKGKTRTLKPGQTLKESEPGDTFTTSIFSAGGAQEGYLNDQARLVAMRQSVIMYRDDPLYRATIDGYVYFIIGKGLKYKARDENPAVQAHLDLFWKENKMDGRDTSIVRSFVQFGELCIRYFKTAGTAKALAKTPRVRLVPFWRIMTTTWNAQDPETLESMEILPYNPANQSTSTTPEVVLAPDLQFVANSQNEAARGEPPFLVIMRACKWYADFILNRVVLNRYRTSFVLFKKIKGAPGNVSAVNTAAANATKSGKGGQLEKRLPKPGTVVVHNESIEYDWKNPDTGAFESHKDGSAIRQYISAGSFAPEFLLGDASKANQDNSLVSDMPFVRKVEFFQDFFEGVFKEMFRRVLEQGIETSAIPKDSTETQLAEAGTIRRTVARVLRGLALAEAADNVERPTKTSKKVPTKTEVDIEWPTLITKDLLEEIKAFQIEQQMGLVSIETLQSKRGYDHEVETARMENETHLQQDTFDAERQREIDRGDVPADGLAAGNSAGKGAPPASKK